MEVTKAEWPASSTVPDGSTGAASVAGVDPSGTLYPGADLLQPDMEVPTPADPPLPISESEKTQTQRSRTEGHLPAMKSWSWAALEGPAPTRQTEEFSRSKGSLKRSQHLGPSDIYLDDLPSLDSENAALYFPQRCLGSGCQGVLGSEPVGPG